MPVLLLRDDVLSLPWHVTLGSDGSIGTTSSIPSDALFLGKEEDHRDPRCLRTLLRLEGVDLPTTWSDAHVRAWSTLSRDVFDPRCVSRTARISAAVATLRRIASVLPSLERRYHVETFVPCSSLFDRLRPMRISPSISESDDPVASSFLPDGEGLVRPPVYDRFGTRTGRLTVVDGPRVLTARRRTRQLFLSIDDDHAVVSLDFSSFEARVALALAGRPIASDRDPYEEMCRLNRLPSRDVAKEATFSAVYSDPTEANSDPHVVSLRRSFRVGEIFSTLREQPIRRNAFGRRFEASDAALYSCYVQSTAADVALLGFLDLLGPLEALGATPHVLIHDALLCSLPRRKLREGAALAEGGVISRELGGCALPLKLSSP